MAAASDTVGLRRVGAQRDILGECPLWDDRAGVLWWVDIRRPAIRRLDPATGDVETFEMPALVGALALTEDDRLLVAMGRHVSLWQPGTRRFDHLAEMPSDNPDHRFNDGRVDRQGRFWVGTMHNVTRAPEGTLYRLDGDRLTPMRDGISIPNALAYSPDGATMYFADSLEHGIDAYALDPATGALSGRRRIHDTTPPGFPDGAVADASGHLWFAEYNAGRVRRITPGGRIAGTLDTPVPHPTACTLGGPDLRTLYITTTCQKLTEAERAATPLAGALLAIEVDVAGLPEPRAALP